MTSHETSESDPGGHGVGTRSAHNVATDGVGMGSIDRDHPNSDHKEESFNTLISGQPPFGRLKMAIKRVGVEKRLKNLKIGSFLRITSKSMSSVFLEGIVVEMVIEGQRERTPCIDLKVLNTKLTPSFMERTQCQNEGRLLWMELDLHRFDVCVSCNVLKHFMDQHEAVNSFHTLNGNAFHFQQRHYRNVNDVVSDLYAMKEEMPQRQMSSEEMNEYQSVYHSFYTHSFSRISIPNPLFFH